MSRILAIDLGKFMSVTCLLDTTTNETEFWTMATDRPYLMAVLKRYKPDLVVIESCTIAGWVHDVCTSTGHKVLICNPNQEAWKWKQIKRKTDRDDALKIAKLAALDQLIPVYMPSERQREYRRLVKYRTVVRGRIGQHCKPLCDCGKDELWRGELDLELSELARLRTQLDEVETKLRELAASPRSPRTSSAFQSTRSSVLDTTYFRAGSIVRAKGSIQSAIQSGLAPVIGGRHAAKHVKTTWYLRT